ncbi:MAG: protein translocase subunit SecD [Chloroflexi bacterium]|nr:protein translocase subunit SecD [Chloroflexota bacterium]MCI0793648.1 protein translocase subunit SecD [Chloroflexota bacterium]MCI0823629.1 protein translocase subunit SecD [Chloroflexota bacterium]MCI0867020.1 protein translocase subunit SecD [Chloroflexota bacterium]MCI0878279.1 protein translocase subunit SecD [Chloroflexota bacterium]
MRARSIRLSIMVLLILGASIAALGFPEINIDLPGFPALERGGTGPLGLKLGLDLRGGGHLVYQADTGTRIDVTFTDDVEARDINEALNELDVPSSVVTRSPRVYSIRSALLDVDTREQVRTTLESKIGSLESFQFTDITNPTDDQMEGVLDIINRRVNLFGTEEPIIQRFGDDRIIVQLPGASGSITRIKFLDQVSLAEVLAVVEAMDLRETAVKQQDGRSFKISTSTLNLRRQAELRSALESTTGGPLQVFDVASGIDEAKALIGQTARLEFKERTCSDDSCTTFNDADLGLTGDDLRNAFATTDPVGVGWVINIQFDDRGSEIFSELTRRIAGVNTKRIAVIMDGEELLAPVARVWIRDGRSQISGSSLDPFTREEARTLSIQLESGRLPVPLKIIQESDVDALLGSESLRQSLIAGLVGLGLVMVFMIAYYRAAGVVATVSLVFYSLIVLALFKLIPITLTLSHIGGFILSIGMAVDANVLIFERMKEELRIGRTLSSSMEVGFNRAWPAIRDGNVSTLITCLVLIWFGDRLGGGLVTGFAISLGIGVMVSMFTAVVVSRNLLQVLAWIGLSRRISLFTPERVQRASESVGGGS